MDLIKIFQRIAFFTFVISFLAEAPVVSTLHITGTWKTGSFFKFLAKFGFQKTNLKDRKSTQGYIYGNITSSHQNLTHFVTLAVLDRGYFLEFFGNSTVQQKNVACNLMFNKINKVAYDFNCNDEGQQVYSHIIN